MGKGNEGQDADVTEWARRLAARRTLVEASCRLKGCDKTFMTIKTKKGALRRYCSDAHRKAAQRAPQKQTSAPERSP
jgi:hypothetical protein